MQHPPLQTIDVDAADGGAIASHRRQSPGQGVVEASFSARSPASSAIAARRSLNPARRARHSSSNRVADAEQLAASASSRQAASPSWLRLSGAQSGAQAAASNSRPQDRRAAR